jgi:glucose/arabinose dehydrogenase
VAVFLHRLELRSALRRCVPDLVKRAIVPDVLIPAHSAALGITFYTGTQFPQRYRNGAFVALHGSWNRSMASGYRVAFFPDDER